MNELLQFPVGVRLLALALPIILTLAAVFAGGKRPFRAAYFSTTAAAVGGLVVAAAGPWVPLESASTGWLLGLAQSVRLDGVTSAMVVLVAGLSLVITHYSDSYLRGDAGRQRYVRALLATLASVMLLVVTENLLVLALSWTASSIALHQLLTHFPNRLQATVAAHKKFLLSRIADACVLGATALLAWNVGSLNISVIVDRATESQSLPWPMTLAALLIVGGVVLKTAQLPFHGWLTQVMEAPTPVSALLHAGVVNIGGLVLIRLSGLMGHSAIASVLLVVIGTTTAVVASLVMTTRVSIKVHLAWSTAAQMGLMLVQCGLGLWHLALLHLLAHSVYKAHAFLSAGETVELWRTKSAAPSGPSVPLWAPPLALLATLPIVLGLAWGLPQVVGFEHGGVGPLAVVLALGLAPMLARGATRGTRALVDVVGASALLIGLTFTWHLGFELLHLGPTPGTAAVAMGWFFVVPAFFLLFGLQVALTARPRSGLATALQPHLFAGLYLDELFTRWTFWAWPPRLPPRREPVPMLSPDMQGS